MAQFVPAATKGWPVTAGWRRSAHHRTSFASITSSGSARLKRALSPVAEPVASRSRRKSSAVSSPSPSKSPGRKLAAVSDTLKSSNWELLDAHVFTPKSENAGSGCARAWLLVNQASLAGSSMRSDSTLVAGLSDTRTVDYSLGVMLGRSPTSWSTCSTPPTTRTRRASLFAPPTVVLPSSSCRLQ